MIPALSLLIVLLSVGLMVKRVEVRLVLLGAGLALGLLGGKPLLLFDTFGRAMVAGMVGPICAAMGFAAVVSATGCDRHLVRLLLAPVGRFRGLALPGGILAAYVLNMAISSQTSTAAAAGPILVPLLVAAGYPLEVATAALLLGASFGGDLLNPGAQDVVAVSSAALVDARALSERVIPAGLGGALVAAFAFAFLNRRTASPGASEAAADDFRLSLPRALAPLVPIALLLAAYSGAAPFRFLVTLPAGDDWKPFAGALPIVRAMLIGFVVTLVVAWQDVQSLTRTLFKGMGEAYGSIISLTITAQCFGAGVAAAGLATTLLAAARAVGALAPLSALFPWALAALSGSGSGPILTFAQTFLRDLGPGEDGVTLAALACFGGAYGRTTSPVSAVVVYCAALGSASPIALIRRIGPALVLGAMVSFALSLR